MSFYEPDGDLFVSTDWTRGPWSRDAQHAGPPAALTGRAIERLPSDARLRVSRFTFEILRPIPVVPLRVDGRVVRDGRRVQLCEAVLSAGDDPIALARAWRIRVASDPPTAEVTDGAPPPDPSTCPEFPFAASPEPSYMNAMEVRTIRGTPFRSPTAAWFRMRRPLVPAEEPSPLQRVLAAADSGNGISAVLDFDRSVFINVDLTVHLVREPAGEWVALDATTRIDPAGIGATESFLWDAKGRLGTAAQSLYVGAR